MTFKTPIIRKLRWMGNTRKEMRKFPEQAQKDMGDALQTIQFGGIPKIAKPFRHVGSGVFEIVYDYDTDTYRAVVAVKIGDWIYVLDAFKKKSKTGIKTPQEIVDRIKQRLKDAKEVGKNG